MLYETIFGRIFLLKIYIKPREAFLFSLQVFSMKMQKFIQYSQFFWIISLIVVVVVVSTIKTVHTQSNKETELTISVKPVFPLTSNVSLEEYGMKIHYVYSKSYSNQHDAFQPLNISEGLISWHSNSTVENVEMFDNFGNKLSPIIEDGTISNPRAIAILPPYFTYKLSLAFDTYYDNDFPIRFLNGHFVIAFEMRFSEPATICISFPANFTIIYSSSNSSKLEGDNFNLRWYLQQNKEYRMFAIFLPLDLNVKLTSCSFTLDVPEVFPSKSFVKGTVEKSYRQPSNYSVWKLKPYLPDKISFPKDSSNLIVEKVWDGIGTCKGVSKPIAYVQNKSLGYYFVDYKGRCIAVYPRCHYEGDFYEYLIGVTFSMHFENETLQLKSTYEDWLPFRYVSRLSLLEFKVGEHARLEITGNLEVKFLLPKEAEALKPENENVMVGFEDGRPIVRFLYNSPETFSTPYDWQVIYDIPSLKSFFFLEVASLIVLLSVFIGIAFGRLPSIVTRVLIASISFPLFLYNLYSLLNLGGSKTLFNLLLLGEVILIILSIVAFTKPKHLWKSALKYRRRATKRRKRNGK